MCSISVWSQHRPSIYNKSCRVNTYSLNNNSVSRDKEPKTTQDSPTISRKNVKNVSLTNAILLRR